MYGDIISRADGAWWFGTAGEDNFCFGPASTDATVAYIDSSGNYHQSSDLRLKENVTNIDDVLDRLLQLRPVSYHFRSASKKSARSLGFIAQEVQPLFPEVVGVQTNGLKDVVYSELVPVAVRSIQELNQKLETQLNQRDSEIQDLKQSNDSLAKKLDALQAAVVALQEKK